MQLHLKRPIRLISNKLLVQICRTSVKRLYYVRLLNLTKDFVLSQETLFQKNLKSQSFDKLLWLT